MSLKENLFQNFNFNNLYSPDFKEDSVREVLILPILEKLGYLQSDIVRSKSLSHPFLKVGSQKRQVNIVPDYLLKVSGNYAWVLDAKGPNEEIKTGDNIEQIYSYSIHPEIRTKFFALCNGKEFILFRQDYEKPILLFDLSEIDYHWDKLKLYLSPNSFQIGKVAEYDGRNTYSAKQKFDYSNRPLLDEIKVQKQSAKRHFGVNAYFTRQAWNILNSYLKNFSQPGDIVLDSFGGSGVTAIESLMLDRKSIHVDLNPLSIFMLESLIAPINQSNFINSFNDIKEKYIKGEPKNELQIKKALKKYPYPQGITLPKGSDVDTIEKLFSRDQLAQLSFLKYLILEEKDENNRKSLMLAFYNTLTICNLTFHDTPKGGGNHFGFYYRYRMAQSPSIQDVISTFERKFKRVLEAKKEIQSKINIQTYKNAIIKKGTATDLSFIKNETVDYIYTDPPYGKKIAYLDLSTMWNGWLDLEVSKEDFELEAIEGGEQSKTKDDYSNLISKSIEELFRVLKFDRWMSFVFAHKDPEFWDLIIETAERAGFEYAGAVKQTNGQTSFKKRQNPFTVLSGQLIINFKKVKNPKSIMKANLGMNITEVVMETIEGIIAKHEGATLEQINDELIIKGLELGFLDLLKKEYTDLTPILMQNFDYDEVLKLFKIKKDAKFRTHVDVKLRIRYYLISLLRRMEIEKKEATFDDIVLYVIPLLKNGKTPEHQTILNILEDIAEKTGSESWRLKTTGQTMLFGF